MYFTDKNAKSYFKKIDTAMYLKLYFVGV